MPSPIVMAVSGQITEELGSAMTVDALFQRIGQEAVEDSIRPRPADMRRQTERDSIPTPMDALGP